MTDLEGNEVDVPGATAKGPSYKYFGAMKFLHIIKYFFDKSPRGEKEEV
jgi:pre-mRNA-splicing factor ISY1